MQHQPFSIAIHGGINTVWQSGHNKQYEQMILRVLEKAVKTGHQVLAQGGQATEAVVQAVKILEDSSHFNSGKGAVLTSNEMVELEAAVIDGKQGDSGAVACVRHIKNPILLARDIMKHRPSGFLVSEGAEKFAFDQGHQYTEQDYFFTEHRYEQLLSIQENQPLEVVYLEGSNLGNIGAVAIDKQGNLAAATSGGGVNKSCGQVSDTVKIGRSIFAENRVAAISFVGGDESLFSPGLAEDVIARVRYLGENLKDACWDVINKKHHWGERPRGLVAIDAQGRVYFAHRSPAMYQAAINAQGQLRLTIDTAR
ncbi:hypothetical protein BS333_12615 [Vibrio azureus]|uniref:Isoaspartyl peptidase n=1 Tax=Vibrio azureus NBRC 104587 TaxID=1219077 RepID=U3ATQ2_9VIBR|nr:isoaspartyl peptidase/L-asparaginase family protein [Vibrio azureus]AUI87143.1 hypothetical protein BS333_12615 [Vibrio azureus]GAD77135.1 isoaspartyl peptidase [Vibrio azureus NBRC 104587]